VVGKEYERRSRGGSTLPGIAAGCGDLYHLPGRPARLEPRFAAARQAATSRGRPAPTPCCARGLAACVPACLRWSSGCSSCLPWRPVHPRSPRVSLSFVPTRPFPRPQGSDTIPIAGRPTVQFNPFYPAGPLVRSRLCPARGPPDKSLFVGPSSHHDTPLPQVW